MAVTYKATNDVFDTLKGQVEKEIGELLDDTVIFDGSLEDAIRAHLSEARSVKGSWLFFGFSDDSTDAPSGSGSALRQGMTVDFYIVVRAKGKSRYKEDRERLNDLADKVMFDVFDTSNWITEMQTNVASMQFSRRQRVDSGSELLARLVRFVCIPRR